MSLDQKDCARLDDEPTQLLLTCHDKIRHFSTLLLRLDLHLIHYGIDEEARAAARSILSHFDIEVPLHHADEESDLFPALRALGDIRIVSALDMLRVEHKELRNMWRSVRPWLEAVQQRKPLLRPASLGAFAARYPAYADREEREVYFAVDRLSQRHVRLLTDSMRRRREQGK